MSPIRKLRYLNLLNSERRVKQPFFKRYQKHSLWLVPVCILLGIVIAMQYKLFQSELHTGGSPANYSTLSRQYNELKIQKEILESDIEQLQAQLDQALTGGADDNISPQYREELQYYMLAGGFSDVSGPGVTIQFDMPDSAHALNLDQFYQDLVLLVNELHAAGAEAVSINDERIIINSEIRLAGNAIMINNKSHRPPFEIKAIGDKDTLEGALTMRFGFVEVARKNGYFIELRKSDVVDIAKYPTKPFFRYAGPSS